jgi:L-ascorbate metabolism protein UlaG (beta-lactamase superfamily)
MLKSKNFDTETGRFHNSDGSENKKSPSQLFKMAKAFLTRAKDPLEDKGFDTLSPADQSDSPTGRQVTWVGHSTLLVSINGQHILTDPIFIGRASPFSFMGPKRAGKTPLGLIDLLKKAGIIQITELDWWQSASHNNIEFTATPVHHWSSRRGFDRNKTLWSGWMVKWPEFSFYFAGDTGYSSDFRETRKRLGAPDLAAIPIGAYNPRPFMKASHVNPEEAVQIFTDLMPKQAVAVHWGTFKLTLEPLQEPPLRLTAALRNAGIEETRFLALQHGQKLHLE